MPTSSRVFTVVDSTVPPLLQCPVLLQLGGAPRLRLVGGAGEQEGLGGTWGTDQIFFSGGGGGGGVRPMMEKAIMFLLFLK